MVCTTHMYALRIKEECNTWPVCKNQPCEPSLTTYIAILFYQQQLYKLTYRKAKKVQWYEIMQFVYYMVDLSRPNGYIYEILHPKQFKIYICNTAMQIKNTLGVKKVQGQSEAAV